MNKRTIIYICCAIAVVLVIAFAIYFIVTANKSENTNEEKITIIQYGEDLNVAKTIDITNKKQLKQLKNICQNPSLEQNEETSQIGIKNDVKVDLNNGVFFMIQLNYDKYCYYEDTNTGTQLIIKMPEGLLETVNEILSEN